MSRRLILGFMLWALIAAEACEWDYPIWIPRTANADPLYRFERGGKAGYIDRTGKVVIQPVLKLLGNSDYEFHDGLVKVGIGGRYIDATLKPAFADNLDVASDFSEELAVARRAGENLWGYVDRSGTFKISPRFQAVPRSFRNGLARIEVDGKFGYIDHTGVPVIPPQFTDAGDFSDGMARVVVGGPCIYVPDGPCGASNLVHVGGAAPKVPMCKFTYLDQGGRVLKNERYDFAREFAEGLAPVQKGGHWGFIDKSGKLAVALRYDDAQPFSDGLARVRMNGSYGYIDRLGKLAIPPWFEYAESFSDNLAVVGNEDEGYWYIGKNGQELIGGRFAEASPFFKGLAHVQLLDEDEGPSDMFAYIDTSGRKVFRYER